jgi:NADH:ubiquinone oxidoreductase subunit 4 (subunit M)
VLTTALILLPIAGALVVAILPLPRETTAGLAFLVALLEVALWITAAARFDFDDGGVQLGTSRPRSDTRSGSAASARARTTR